MKSVILSTVCILLSISLFAQRGRGRVKHYKHYNYNRSAVVFVPRYNYRPYYRPQPVFRPMVHPVYRSPRAVVHFGPVFGLRVNVLPAGFSRVFVGPAPYYYNNGVYYRSYPRGGYEVVAPPLDAVVSRLPANATVTIIDGQKYYQVGGSFYQEEVTNDNRLRYRVVGTDGVLNTSEGYTPDEAELNAVDEEIPVLGSRFESLPVDSKVQVINGRKYFVSTSGIYYKEIIEDDKILYEVTTVE